MGNLTCTPYDTVNPCRMPPGAPLHPCSMKSSASDIANVQLLRACEKGDIDAIIEALASGADIECRQIPFLNHMKEHDDLDIPSALESQEVVEFKDGGIFSAETGELCRCGHEWEATKPAPAPFTHSRQRMPGLTPLMQAAKEGKAMAVALLLDAKASPHASDEVGMQPLHFAASVGCRESCMYLMGARACPSARDEARRDVFSCLPPRCLASPTERNEWASLFEVLPPQTTSRPSRENVLVVPL